jgi:phospholipase C
VLVKRLGRLLGVLLAALAACTSAPPPIALSGEVTMDGPVVGVSVRLVDASGHVYDSAPTDRHGAFHFAAAPLTAPLLLAAPVADADGAPVYLASVVTAEELAGRTRVRANLNPLAGLLTERLLGEPLRHLPDAQTLTALHAEPARVATERHGLQRALQPLGAALGLAPETLADLGVDAEDASVAANGLQALLALTRVRLAAGQLEVSAQEPIRVNVPLRGELPAPASLTAAQLAAIKVAQSRQTTTPIEHLIVIVGENLTFDSVFATYAPSGERVLNLRSQGIVREDGSPGEQYARAAQQRATPQAHYSVDPPRAGVYAHLPRPTLIGVTDAHYHLLGNGPDPRFPADLPPGPFPITRYVKWPALSGAATLAGVTANLSAATGDPVHRFFQMWQQTGGDNARRDLFVWVATTTGMGGDTRGVTAANPGQGGELMSFANIAAGDAPVFLDLASHSALSDNYHQSVMGGTGANFYSLSTGDVPYFTAQGAATTPPDNQIEDPDPTSGTENFYKRDGYQGGSYVACADARQPGVAPILAVLERQHLPSRCELGHYYLVNNYAPGYDLDGHPQPIGAQNYNYPPQSMPTIASALAAHGISWGWYTGARDAADLTEEMRSGRMSLAQARRLQYNFVGDPLVASTAVMSSPEQRANLKGLASFSAELAAHTLPAVAFLVPKNLDSGHPGYSQQTSLEEFLAAIIAQVKGQPSVWAHTAIIVTTDEGGGHFDSGYIQTLDFFGDGPRVPLLVISPYARAGHIDHVYNDHGSILKFIERNWRLAPLSERSRDNLPDPVARPEDPYRPINGPAIGDLSTLFEF